MPARKIVLRRAALGAAALAATAAAVVALLWATLPDPAFLARENPRTTALIEQRAAEAKARRRPFRPRQAWVPLAKVSPRLVQAVLYSEDPKFFGHEGIDWEAVREAAEYDLEVGRFARGASTLTQQLAKNLWLGTEKNLWRKAKEAVLAAKLERTLSKKRILSLYLNVVELDDGVFGVEAGARDRFGGTAASLTTAQSVVLASMLPAPRRVNLRQPSAWLKKRSRALLDRLLAAGRISADEHMRASTELERILAGPAPADDREEPPADDAPPEPVRRDGGPSAPVPEPHDGAEAEPVAAPAVGQPELAPDAPAGVAAPVEVRGDDPRE
jgi:monofunctional biosynthetic peptidoglycan transglycosylase